MSTGQQLSKEEVEATKWLNAVEDAGAFAPLGVLEQLVNTAPLCVQETRDFGYLCGIVDTRRLFAPLPPASKKEDGHEIHS